MKAVVWPGGEDARVEAASDPAMACERSPQ